MTQLYEHNIDNALTSAIKAQKEGLYYFIPTRTVAFAGYNNSIETAFCKENGIQIIDVKNEGGVIVSGANSLAIGYLSKKIGNTANQDFAMVLIEWLSKKGLNVSTQGNDILIDGKYKVASYSSRRFGDIIFSAFHISFNVNLQLIERLCKKPMNKIPKGLDEFNISYRDIYSLFLANIDKFN
jgi:hypothetical protein